MKKCCLMILFATLLFAACSGGIATSDSGTSEEGSGEETGFAVTGSINSPSAVNQSALSLIYKASSLGDDAPASGYSVHCYNFVTGASCGETVTDAAGRFDIRGLDEAQLADPNDAAKFRFWIVALSPSGQHEIINYAEASASVVGSERTITVSADTDTTIAAQLMLDHCRDMDTACSIGSPLPVQMVSEIASSSFDPVCFLELNKSYLDGADLSGDGFRKGLGAVRQGLRCMMSMGISPRTCGDYSTTMEIVDLFANERADASLIECMSSVVSGACGIDAQSFSSAAGSANEMFAGIRRATAANFASSTEICGDIIQGTALTGDAISETVLSIENREEADSVLSDGRVFGDFINIAKDSGDFSVFTERPRAFIGMIESRLSSAKYVEAYEVMREWTPGEGTTASQMNDWGRGMNRLFAVSETGEIAAHAEIYVNYIDNNVARLSVGVDNLNYLNMYNDIKGAIGLAGGSASLADQYISAVRIESYRFESDSARSLYDEQVTQIQYQQQQGWMIEVDYPDRYENEDSYSGMCGTYLQTSGYTPYYQQYCGSRPAAPSIQVSAGNTQAVISWLPVSGAASYNLYWGTSANSINAKVGGVTSPYTQQGLANGSSYYYLVRAVNSHGEGLASNTASALPLPPLPVAPGNVAASAGDAEVGISWNNVSGAASYNIYFGTSEGVTKETGTKLSGVSSPYTHSNRINGTRYYYAVVAENLRGEGPLSQIASAMPNYTAPGAPTNTASAAGNTQVTVSWNSVAGATAYNIYWGTSTGVTVLNGTKIPNAASPYVHTGRTNATAYYYMVTAVNSGVEGPASLETNATPMPPLPAAPGGLTAVAGDAANTVSWNAVSGATVYNIYWRTSAGVTKANGTKISGATSPHTHSGLTNGTTYYYVATAENISGEGDISVEASAMPQASLTLWTRTYNGGTNNGDYGWGVAVDQSGNAYVCGSSIYAAPRYLDVWLSKYDTSGSISWTETVDGGLGKAEQCNSVAVDSSSNIYMTAEYYRTASYVGAWLRKYDSNRNVAWTYTYNAAANSTDEAFDVALDASGNSYIMGYTYNPSLSSYYVFVTKVNSAGSAAWTRTVAVCGSDTWSFGRGVAVDSSGNVYVGGEGEIYDCEYGYSDIWFRKYDANGNTVWTHTEDGPAGGMDDVRDLAVDSSGNLYATGSITVSGQGSNIWVAKYNSSGNKLWSSTYNGTSNLSDSGYKIAVDSNGNAYVAGVTTDTGQNNNIWVRKYDTNGNVGWTQSFNGAANGSDQGTGIAIGENGGVYVTGYTYNGSNYDIWTRVYSAEDGSFN